jgi:hypothetical protein
MRALVLGVVLAAATAAGAAASPVGGRYVVNGTNANGSSYSGMAEIFMDRDHCSIVWHVGAVWRGICMLSGDIFAASYGNGRSRGMLIYHLSRDGSLSGDWRLVGAVHGGTETLIPVP